MPEFVCRLGAPDGSVLEQRRMAMSAEALRQELEQEGFHVFSVTAPRMRIRVPGFSRREKVKSQDFMIFNTQLRTLLRAGLPLTQSLELLAAQQASPHFRSLLEKVHQQVTTGVALSDAFLSLGDNFPRLYANTLRAGERSGDLEGMLQRFTEYQKTIEAAKRKVVGALTYPAVLIMLSIGLVTLMMTYVIPNFTGFYQQLDAQLPLPTKILIAVAQFMHDEVAFIVAGLVALIWGSRAWHRTPRGRKVVDRLQLRIPILGNLAHMFALSQFTRSLGVMLGGGIPMVPSLETAVTSINNAWISENFLNAIPQVREGQALSDSLEKTGLVPELAIAMMRVGESTGALPEMLAHTSEFLDEDIDFLLNRIVTLLEPAVLVFMGLVVAGLLLAVYYPLLTLVSRMH
ncbi:MAG TPA: type II secretion system F family protein [Acidobacteria bacterium]|nr:type II secretion system F family protein [Acidobacteriota bacterium]